MATITYSPTEWANDKSGGTPITAARLNNMENGIANACKHASDSASETAAGHVKITDNLFYDSADSLTAASVEAIRKILFSWTVDSTTTIGSPLGGQITVSHNADGSLFKVYGLIGSTHTSAGNLSLTSIPGGSSVGYAYGFKTGYVGAKPSKAFIIKNGGTYNSEGMVSGSFIVGTDGYVYVMIHNSSSRSCAGGTYFYFPACIFVNSDFGDN